MEEKVKIMTMASAAESKIRMQEMEFESNLRRKEQAEQDERIQAAQDKRDALNRAAQAEQEERNRVAQDKRDELNRAAQAEQEELNRVAREKQAKLNRAAQTKIEKAKLDEKKRKREEEEEEELDAEDIQYIKESRELQQYLKHFSDDARWGELKGKHCEAGFLIKLLDARNITYTAEEEAEFKMISMESVGNKMQPSYGRIERIADGSKARPFSQMWNPSWEYKDHKAVYKDFYMAFLRIMADPFVARHQADEF